MLFHGPLQFPPQSDRREEIPPDPPHVYTSSAIFDGPMVPAVTGQSAAPCPWKPSIVRAPAARRGLAAPGAGQSGNSADRDQERAVLSRIRRSRVAGAFNGQLQATAKQRGLSWHW